MKPEEKLAEWSEDWVSNGLLTAAQRDAILARHPVPEAGPSRFLGILAMVGGSLFVVGVSLVISSNWERIGDWVKIAGMIALLVGAYGLGWWLRKEQRYPKLGDACLMVGSVGFLLGIGLVSQIFHLNSRPPNGVLLWWLGIVALPWLTRARGLQLVSLAAGLVWFGMELDADDSWLRLHTGMWSEEYLVAAMGVFIGVSLVLFGMGLRHGRHATFAGLHEKSGILVACAALYTLGFTWSADVYPDAMEGARWQPFLVVGLLGFVAAGWACLRNFDELKLVGWFLLLALVPATAHLAGIDLRDSGWLWGGVSCVALFLLNIGMIRSGLKTGRESWINLGIAGIALNIVTRHFLLFGTMLEGGVFFIVTGLLIVGVGWYLEHKRRNLVGALRKEVVP